MRAILIVRPGEGAKPAPSGAELYARIGAEGDLSAAVGLNPAGLVIPVTEGGRDVARLGARLAVHEAEAGLADGATRILAMIETASAVLALPTLAGASPRLCGIAWDADALGRDIRAMASRDGDGALIPPLAFVRAQVLLAAAAAGVEAVDTACAIQGAFMREVEEARRDGFRAKVAASSTQLEIMSSDGVADTSARSSVRSASPPRKGRGARQPPAPGGRFSSNRFSGPMAK